jgi:hypothetical protein
MGFPGLLASRLNRAHVQEGGERLMLDDLDRWSIRQWRNGRLLVWSRSLRGPLLLVSTKLSKRRQSRRAQVESAIALS